MCPLQGSGSSLPCSPLVVPLCRAQLLEEEEEETSRPDPLRQLGLLFQGEQAARAGGNQRRTALGAARKRGRDTGSARGSRDPRGLRAPLLAKGSAARSETSSSSSFSSGVAMCCKSPERAQLYLPALPSAAPERRADQLIPSETLGPTLVRFSLSRVPCKAKQNQTQLS